MPWLCWEQFFLMLSMVWADKGSSLNLDFMLFGIYVVIMIMLMFIYVDMCVWMYVMFDGVIMDHDCLMLMFVCIYVCVCIKENFKHGKFS